MLELEVRTEIGISRLLLLGWVSFMLGINGDLRFTVHSVLVQFPILQTYVYLVLFAEYNNGLFVSNVFAVNKG